MGALVGAEEGPQESGAGLAPGLGSGLRTNMSLIAPRDIQGIRIRKALFVGGGPLGDRSESVGPTVRRPLTVRPPSLVLRKPVRPSSLEKSWKLPATQGPNP